MLTPDNMPSKKLIIKGGPADEASNGSNSMIKGGREGGGGGLDVNAGKYTP